jgi:hypothetical protein
MKHCEALNLASTSNYYGFKTEFGINDNNSMVLEEWLGSVGIISS